LTKTSSYQVRGRDRERELHGPERERCAPFGIPKFGREVGWKGEKRGKRKSCGSKSVKASLVHMTAALKKVRAFVL
jgi:hypothetical protein